MAPPVQIKSISCSKCSKDIKSREYLRCCHCNNYYDLLCGNVSDKRFHNTMREEHKNNWKCDKCASASCDDNGSSGVTLRNRSGKQPTSSSPNNDDTVASMSSDLIIELRLLREESRAARAEMQEFRSSICSLTSAISACNERIDDLALRVESVENKISDSVVSGQTAMLEQAIADLKLELNDRDQALLYNDIELTGLPEMKNENLIHLTVAIAVKLGITIEERDIVSAERVGVVWRSAAAEERSARPRPMAVRLVRRSLRDDIIAAARVRRNITTDGLGLDLPARHVYLNERLTRYNRKIFAKARAESKRCNWSYVWTRDGKVFARKEQGAPRYCLRSESDIDKIFGHLQR